MHFCAKVFEHLRERQKVVQNCAVFEQILKIFLPWRGGDPLSTPHPPGGYAAHPPKPAFGSLFQGPCKSIWTPKHTFKKKDSDAQ